MKGLLLKDLFVLKHLMRTIALLMLMCVVYVALGWFDYSFFAVTLSVFCVMGISSTFSYDHYYKWESYCNALPVSRETMVREKYLLGIILLSLSTVISTLIIAVGSLLPNGKDDGFSSLAGAIIASVAMIAILLPMLYKFGAEKTRIYFTIAILAVFAFFMLIFKNDKNISAGTLPSVDNIAYSDMTILLIAILAAFGFLFVSYKISCGIMKNKEF